MLISVEYYGVGITLLFAIVTSTISGIQPILRQTLFGEVFLHCLLVGRRMSLVQL